jgi:hypothetical protein
MELLTQKRNFGPCINVIPIIAKHNKEISGWIASESAMILPMLEFLQIFIYDPERWTLVSMHVCIKK